MNTRRQLLLILGIALASTGVGAAVLNAGSTLTLSAQDVEHVGLTDIRDVSASQLSPTEDKLIAQAESKAWEYLGTQPSTYRLYFATSVLELGGPPRDVIVIVVPGGSFGGEPIGAPAQPSTPRMTGLVMDAATGEFVRGFVV